MLGQMNETMEQLAIIGLLHRHPDASETELRRRLADIFLGSNLAARVLGPFP